MMADASRAPHAYALERVLIGLLLQRPALLDHPALSADLFVGGDTHTALRVLRGRYAAGEAVDLATVVAPLAAAGIQAPALFAMECWEEATPHVVAGVLPVLQEVAQRRVWWRAARTLDALVNDPDPEGQPEALATLVDQLSDGMVSQVTRRPRPAPVIVAEYVEQITRTGGVPGLATGFALLDHILGGFRAGELSILAARTSVGKSAWAVQVAERIARRGAHVLYVSPEMSDAQIAERLVAGQTGLPTHTVRYGPFAPGHLAAMQRSAQEMPPSLATWDASGITTGDVALVARQHQATAGLDLLVVDHLGFLADRTERGENRALTMGRMTKSLKALARRLGVHALVVHQLNRGSEEAGTMRTPGISDLRDSGMIEEDADNVLLLHRETREAMEASLIVGKNRQGPTGEVPLTFFAETTTFQARRQLHGVA